MKKLNTRKRVKNIALAKAALVNIKRLQVFFALFLVLAVFLYLYFLFASLYSTAVRKDYQKKISRLNAQIAELEANYFDAYNKLSSIDFEKEGYRKLTDSDKMFAKKSKYLGRMR